MKNYRPILYILFFYFHFCYLYSQETKEIIGKIYLDDINEELDNIYVTNLNTGYTSITDVTGKFKIIAQDKDILEFKAGFINRRLFIINKNNFDKGVLFIQLNVKCLELQQVTIFPYKISGNLEQDIKRQKIDTKMDRLRVAIGIPEATGDGKINKEAIFPSIFSMNVGALSDYISGKQRKRANLYKYEGREKIITQVIDYFTKEYFENELEIPKTEIYNFLVYNYETTTLLQYVQNHDYLAINDLLKKNSAIYRIKLKNTSYLKQK